jgi:hypothetical protein
MSEMYMQTVKLWSLWEMAKYLGNQRYKQWRTSPQGKKNAQVTCSKQGIIF